MKIKVAYEIEIAEADVPKLLRYAEQQGHACKDAYGDSPGKEELMRRLLIDEGVNGLETECPMSSRSIDRINLFN